MENQQQQVLKFITYTNWILFFVVSVLGLILSPPDFARGIIFGGLLVTINFHLLYRTLKKAFKPKHLSSLSVILAKRYFRFIVSGFIIFFLISKHYVDPLGLLIGLSIVVASIIFAAIFEFKQKG
ncbi:MAG: ATP synthase subunit I [Deltaproteobacteria bacterium]|nr:ATP synthase subunit I [Deltaproteobacteria bacterium]